MITRIIRILRLRDVAKPNLRNNEVLVKIIAALVNYVDWSSVRGKPFLLRLMQNALFHPKNKIFGTDISGWIEAIGKNITQFIPGDEVYGDLGNLGLGGFAEYAVVPLVKDPPIKIYHHHGNNIILLKKTKSSLSFGIHLGDGTSIS